MIIFIYGILSFRNACYNSQRKYEELSKKRRDFMGKYGFYWEYSVKALQNVK